MVKKVEGLVLVVLVLVLTVLFAGIVNSNIYYCTSAANCVSASTITPSAMWEHTGGISSWAVGSSGTYYCTPTTPSCALKNTTAMSDFVTDSEGSGWATGSSGTKYCLFNNYCKNPTNGASARGTAGIVMTDSGTVYMAGSNGIWQCSTSVCTQVSSGTGATSISTAGTTAAAYAVGPSQAAQYCAGTSACTSLTTTGTEIVGTSVSGASPIGWLRTGTSVYRCGTSSCTEAKSNSASVAAIDIVGGGYSNNAYALTSSAIYYCTTTGNNGCGSASLISASATKIVAPLGTSNTMAWATGPGGTYYCDSTPACTKIDTTAMSDIMSGGTAYAWVTGSSGTEYCGTTSCTSPTGGTSAVGTLVKVARNQPSYAWVSGSSGIYYCTTTGCTNKAAFPANILVTGSTNAWVSFTSKANGQVCTADNECTTPNCDTDFDTTDKYCHATSTSCVDYSLGTPWERATGYELCSANDWYKSCTSSVWGSEVNNPDLYNDYCSAQGDSQGGYDLAATCTSGDTGGFNDPGCTACTNGYRATTSKNDCYSNCASNDDLRCISTYHCASGDVCAEDLETGESCEANSDCDSNYCRDDYTSGKYCAADNNDCVHNGASYDYGTMLEGWQCNNGIWEKPCRFPYDWTDGNETNIDEMDLEYGERCFNATTHYESFKTKYYSATLNNDSINKGGWVKMLLIGEQQSGKKWCVYIFKHDFTNRTKIVLTEDQGSSPYCDGDNELVIDSVITQHAAQGVYYYNDSDMYFYYNADLDYLKVAYKDSLIGTVYALTSAKNQFGQIDGAKNEDFITFDIEGSDPEFQGPEFSSAGVVLAVTLIMLFTLVLRRKKSKK